MSTYSLSGLEYRILKLAHRPNGYSLTMDGPWWMKLLYDCGILQIYVNRLLDRGYLKELRVGWQYQTSLPGFYVLYRDVINNEKHIYP